VRGWRKVRVAGLLAASATATGALAGFTAGVPAAVVRLDGPSPLIVAAVALGAVALDLVAARTGRAAPPSVRRQVPRAWSQLFSPPTVAVLYGARLGVGPLTILPTWLWWAAFVLSAWFGPAVAAAAGAVFGLVRTAVMIGLAEWVAPAAPARMARLRGGEAAVRWAGTAAVVVLAAVLAVPRLG
jgi:hypothetical protein